MENTRELLFSNWSCHLLPSVLGAPLGILVLEQRESGISTAADETCHAIEAWFKFVGGLLVSEYLNSGAPDNSLNRYVFAALESSKGMSVGQWVATGRGCLTPLQSYWAEGNEPTWPGLKKLDFGVPGDEEHPVSRLITYRNSFSHGSFSQVEERILEHGWLLEDQVALIADDLIKHPICFPVPDGKVAILQGAEPGETSQTVENETAPSDIPAYTPYVTLEDGNHSILAPGLQIKQNGEDFDLALGSLKATLDEAFLQAFQNALEIYRREQQGYVEFEVGDLPETPMQSVHIEGLETALKDERPLTLVQYRPGKGQVQLAASINYTIASNCSMGEPWRIIPNHPGGDAAVFARALLRQAELLLKKEEGELESKGVPLLDSITDTAKTLTDANKTVSYVLLDADKASDPAVNSGLSWVELLKTISFEGSGFRIVLLAKPSNNQSLPYDGEILSAPIPDASSIDRNELDNAVQGLIKEHGDMGATVLSWILEGDAGTPKRWSEVTTVLSEKHGTELFPPAVEHTLWSLAPLAEREDHEEGHTWYPAGGPKADYGEAIRQSFSEGIAT